MIPRPILRFLVAVLPPLLFCGCVTTAATSTPGQGQASRGVPDIGQPYPGAEAYIVLDAFDGKVLLSRSADQKRAVASLTKVATAAVVLDLLRNSGGASDSEIMTVPDSVGALGVPSPLGLRAGDRISVRDALYAAMMGSDNFAAETLAAHFGGRLVSAGMGGDPMRAFVNQMNGLAGRLGLRDTRFANPHGLDLPGMGNVSTAADMARLFAHAMGIPGFSFYSSQKERKISFARMGAKQSLVVRNTNEIIGRDRIDAGKTGTTRLAGQCLVVTAGRPSTVRKNADGSTTVIPNRLVVVVLAAQDRFGLARQLLRDGWAACDAWRAAGSPAGNGDILPIVPGSRGMEPPSLGPAPRPAAPQPAPAPAAPSGSGVVNPPPAYPPPPPAYPSYPPPPPAYAPPAYVPY